GAAAWLSQVAAQHADTKDKRAAEMIRDKVQEFCEAFIPATVRLDERVLIRGKEVPRKAVEIKYIENGETKRAPLSDDPDGLNEFNVEKRHPGESTFVVHGGATEFPKDLKPTELSTAAVAFQAARKSVGDGATGPKWTATSVAVLKKKCEAQQKL